MLEVSKSKTLRYMGNNKNVIKDVLIGYFSDKVPLQIE